MKHSAQAFAAAVPLLFGAISPSHGAPVPPAAVRTERVTPVDFVDRLLHVGRPHRAKSTSARKRSSSAERETEAPSTDLPATVPVPLPRPTEGGAVTVPTPKPADVKPEENPARDMPAPAPKKEEETPDATTPEPEKPRTTTAPSATPDAAKEPSPPKEEEAPDATPPKPVTPGTTTGPSTTPDAKTEPLPPKEEEEPPEIVHEDPAALKACLADLSGLGAKFERPDSIDEGGGCGIESPVKIDEIMPGLSLGGAVMRCETALGLAHWLKDSVQPALEVAKPGRKITGITAGTTYACRLRNGASTGMVSEHALGNAFDVAALKLDNGERIDMKPRQDDHTIEGAFQKAITAGACLHFTTVLAPGSDAAHETHLHVDIRDRKGGYRICESP